MPRAFLTQGFGQIMKTLLLAIPIVALGMLGLGLSMLLKRRPMKQGGCGGHRAPKNGLLGDRASSPRSCACQDEERESCPGR